MLEFLPPRDEHAITLDGYAVPFIEAFEIEAGTKCNISVDGRFGITVPTEVAEQVIWLLAHSIAIGAGYTCHGEHSRRANPFKVRVMGIGTVTDEEGNERQVGDGDG